MCDIEAMFHQFKVNKMHRNFLILFWWRDTNTNSQPIAYRMTVRFEGLNRHQDVQTMDLRGLQKKFGSDAADFVDDGLKSVDTVDKAVQLIHNTTNMCKAGGLCLHKFVSNSKRVTDSVPPEDQAKGFKDLHLGHDALPMERTIEVLWCVESDTFQFRIALQGKPMTRLDKCPI